MTKSAKTRALELCRQLNLPTFESGHAFIFIFDALQKQAEDTERDTRHACAEAISKLEQGAYTGGAIDADAARTACMDAKLENER